MLNLQEVRRARLVGCTLFPVASAARVLVVLVRIVSAIHTVRNDIETTDISKESDISSESGLSALTLAPWR